MRYDLKPIRCFKISNFTDLVIHGVLRPFYPKTRPPGASVHLFRETFECRQIFPKTTHPAHNRGESLNVDKVLPGLLLISISVYLTNPREHPEALGGYCRGNT